jgi:hypothetical protein
MIPCCQNLNLSERPIQLPAVGNHSIVRSVFHRSSTKRWANCLRGKGIYLELIRTIRVEIMSRTRKL